MGTVFREQEQHQAGRKVMQSFLSPSGPPRLLLVLTHILDLFARPQAAPCLSRHPRLQPGIQGYNQPTCAPYLSCKVRSRGWGGRGDSAPMSAKHLLRK